MSQAWFAEVARSGFQQKFEVRRLLWKGRSEHQSIEILDTVPFGRALVLDGALQTTEADEFCYHEMLVHVPLVAHSGPRRVLIVGGGDGGALRHVLMHPVEQAVQVEIDEMVVRACRDWMPRIADDAFEDVRAQLVIGDGLAYLREPGEPFDVILVDSTDPVGPAEGLISEQFFRLAASRLRQDGLLVVQTGSPLLMQSEMLLASRRMAAVFPGVMTYTGHVPSYPGVLWSYTVGAHGRDATEPARAAPPGARYYSHSVHRAAFALPSYVQSILDSSADVVRSHGGPILG